MLRGMETESVDAIITDPPYGISFQSKRRADRFAKIAGDKRPFIWWLWDATRVLKDGGVVVCFSRWGIQHTFIDAMGLAGLKVKNVIVWDKMRHGAGDLKSSFGPRYETVIFATKGKFTFPGKRPQDLVQCDKVPEHSLAHPNEKPVELLEWFIEAVTVPGALILDPFAGSGSTLAAAVKTGRRCIGVELDERYAEIALERVKKWEETKNDTRREAAVEPGGASIP